jgi:HSP20 family protein
MSLLVKKNGSTFPNLVSELFNTDVVLRPNLFDLSSSLLNGLNPNLPSTNISEDEKSFKIELAAPGLERKDFKVETQDGTLTISSEKEKESKEEKENYRRREFSYSSFSRSFQLPENSLPEKIEAKYEEGILRLTLPKKETTETKHRKEIKVS